MEAKNNFAILSGVLFGTMLALTCTPAQAADPQPYTVEITHTKVSELDQALADSSLLLSLREKSPIGPFALLARAQEDGKRFVTTLNSFGYYKAEVNVRIAGRAPDDPDLPDSLDKAPSGAPVTVKIAIKPGPLFRLGNIVLEGEVPEAARARLGLKSGDAALAPQVLAAGERLESALKDLGYPHAHVDTPVATLRAGNDSLDVTFKVNAGSRAELGHIALKGLRGVDEAFVRRRLKVSPGDPYKPSSLDEARKDLVSTGVFSSVRVHPDETLDSEGRLPLTFELSEHKLHAVSLNVAYSTDLGASFAVSWQHRNLFGNAEQLNVTGAGTQFGGTSSTGIGYILGAQFLKPDFRHRDQTLQADLGAVKQSLTAYDREAITGDVLLNRRFGRHWTVGAGFSAEQSHIVQEGSARDYTLVGLPLNARYEDTDNLLDPTRGARASFSLIPTQPLASAKNQPFVILQMTGSTYLDLAEPGRTILALRGGFGAVEGADASDLPPDKRFYAGGSATVRGFKYQSIGPQFSSDHPKGGTALVSGTLELRQRILESYGVVAFLDAGQVAESGLSFSDSPRLGAGLGARYYTALGPIRLDVAVPVTRQSGGDAFEIYIGLGQAF